VTFNFQFIFKIGLSGAFVKEVQVFVKQLFLSGQNDLQSREQDSTNSTDKDSEKEDSSPKSVKAVNRFKLTVLANAVCVDILVWATKDENGNYTIIP
jgi:phosphatidylinositol 4-kinase